MKDFRQFWRCAPFLVLLAGSGTSLRAQEVKNIAAAKEGGQIIFFASQYDDSTWNVKNLIDGSAGAGWAGASNGAQSVIIAFKNNALAEIHDILINPYTRENNSTWAKDVEIQVSARYPFRDFRTVGKYTLKQEGSSQVFSLPEPTRARYVKIRFLSNHGGGYMEAGEIEVMGRLLPDAPPAPKYRNAAALAEGAKIEKFSSQYDDSTWAVTNLLKEDGGQQWAGQSAASQEVIVALPDVKQITDIAINNYSKEDPKTWAKDVEIETSSTYAYKGFTPVGKLSLSQIGDLHGLSLSQPTSAKYVKVLFRTNHGGGYMEAARIRVFETERVDLSGELAETGRAVVREIQFATNSAEILPPSEPVLQQIAAVLKNDPKLQLIIEGHTDNVGGADFNLELSRKRAEAVKRWLVDQTGIAEARLTTAGYGLTRPVADNSTEEGRARNRRVELVRR